MRLQFTVLGVPQPQGSKRIGRTFKTHRPVVIDDNADKLLPWRQQVGLMARAVAVQSRWIMIRRPAPVQMELAFYFDRPESTKKGAPKTTKPDVDKLQRAVLDSLTGVIFQDDAQVNDVHAIKRFAEEGTGARVEILVIATEQGTAKAGGGQAQP